LVFDLGASLIIQEIHVPLDVMPAFLTEQSLDNIVEAKHSQWGAIVSDAIFNVTAPLDNGDRLISQIFP
jgi:hypothetical protein